MNNYNYDVLEQIQDIQLDYSQPKLNVVFPENELSTIRFYQMTDYYGRPKFSYDISVGVINAFFPDFKNPSYTVKAKVVDYNFSQKPNTGGENSTEMTFSPSIKLLLDSQTQDGKNLSEMRKLGLICCTIDKEVILPEKDKQLPLYFDIKDFYIVSDIRLPNEISEVESAMDEKANQFINISLYKLTDIRTDSGLSISFGVINKQNKGKDYIGTITNSLPSSSYFETSRILGVIINNFQYCINGVYSTFFVNWLDRRKSCPLLLLPVDISNNVKYVNIWNWDRFISDEENIEYFNGKSYVLERFMNGTLLRGLFLGILSLTYNIRNGFNNAKYDDKGNPYNGVAKLKNDLGSQSPKDFITNKISLFELKYPDTVISKDFTINFLALIAIFSKYIDCNYSINGGNNEINKWLLKYHGSISTPPVLDSATELYKYTEKTMFKVDINVLYDKYLDFLNDPERKEVFKAGDYEVISGQDTIYFPKIKKIINEQTITFYPSKINGDDNYKKYIFLVDYKKEVDNWNKTPFFDINSVESNYRNFDFEGSSKLKNVKIVEKIIINGIRWANFFRFDMFANNYNNTNQEDEYGLILFIDDITRAYYSKNQSLAEMQINL